MLSGNRLALLILLFVVLVVTLFFVFRRSTQAAYGPAIALCPGPDQYGYTCESGAGYAYIDATNDTRLYEDDGMIVLELPFPFIFYGTTYHEVQASVNGNLQFANNNPTFANDCLTDGPIPDMGDMIAPYFDDLDLRLYGYLETAVVGEEPNRIFVVEWDAIPRYGDYEDDLVTFEVQLFEGSNDIVFLYEDVTTFDGYNGSGATIGLQSAAQGLALQYSCDQPVISDATSISFPFPLQPNGDIGQENTGAGDNETAVLAPTVKGPVADLIQSLNQSGTAVLPALRTHWLSQNPPRSSEWASVDLTGDGRSELILLWSGTLQHPNLSQLFVLTPDENGQMTLLFNHSFAARAEVFPTMRLVETADLTTDSHPDLLLEDRYSHQLFVLSAVNGSPELLFVPERCNGSLSIQTENGRVLIVRDGCRIEGRVMAGWNGREFTFIK